MRAGKQRVKEVAVYRSKRSASALKSELRARRYNLISRGYLSFEKSLNLANRVIVADVAGYTDDISFLDLVKAMEFALTVNSNTILRINLVELAGNWALYQKREEYGAEMDELRELIHRIYLLNHDSEFSTKHEWFLEELCAVKLTLLQHPEFDRKGPLEDVICRLNEQEARTRNSTKSLSFYAYNGGIFEEPEKWLPEIIRSQKTGNARFFAAYLLTRIKLRHNLPKLLKTIDILIEQEKDKKPPEGDLIGYLEDAKENVLQQWRKLRRSSAKQKLATLDRGGEPPISAVTNPPEKPRSGTRIPKAFVSYSWDNKEHCEWTRQLAARLRGDGVDVTLDQWDTAPGDQLPLFMERAIRENDFVLIICTPQYKSKSDARLGGVGYEGDILTAEVVTGQTQRKFIPLLRGLEWKASAASWLAGKYYIDLRGDPFQEEKYVELLYTLLGKRPAAPPIGNVHN